MRDLQNEDIDEAAYELARAGKLGEDALALAIGGLFSSKEIYEALTEEGKSLAYETARIKNGGVSGTVGDPPKERKIHERSTAKG